MIQLENLAHEAKALAISAGFYPSLIQNFIKTLTNRLRNADDILVENQRRELEHVKLQLAMSNLVIIIISIVSVYIVVLKLLAQTVDKVPNITLIGAPLVFIMAVFFLVYIRRAGYPLEFYGLTFKNWQLAIKEAIPVTCILLVLCVIMKWVLIHFVSGYEQYPLFEPEVNKLKYWGWIVLYLGFIPLQEMIVRGALQSSFQELYTGKRFSPIILSNLLFSVPHFHLSMMFAAEVFFAGLLWGWLYSKRRSLVGVTLSHQIVGFWVFSVIQHMY